MTVIEITSTMIEAGADILQLEMDGEIGPIKAEIVSERILRGVLNAANDGAGAVNPVCQKGENTLTTEQGQVSASRRQGLRSQVSDQDWDRACRELKRRYPPATFWQAPLAWIRIWLFRLGRSKRYSLHYPLAPAERGARRSRCSEVVGSSLHH